MSTSDIRDGSHEDAVYSPEVFETMQEYLAKAGDSPALALRLAVGDLLTLTERAAQEADRGYLASENCDDIAARIRALTLQDLTAGSSTKTWLCVVCAAPIRRDKRPSVPPSAEFYEHISGFGIRDHFAERPVESTESVVDAAKRRNRERERDENREMITDYIRATQEPIDDDDPDGYLKGNF